MIVMHPKRADRPPFLRPESDSDSGAGHCKAGARSGLRIGLGGRNQAARTELRNLPTSSLGCSLSPDSDRAAASTCQEAEPVSPAPHCTSVPGAETCPGSHRGLLRVAGTCVAAPCSSTAAAIVDEISDSFSMVPLIAWIAFTDSCVAAWMPEYPPADLAGRFCGLLRQGLQWGRRQRASRPLCSLSPSEVKALAEQTAKATGEIGQQISGIQAATQELVNAIQAISGTIEKLSEISSTIAAAVEEQGAATQEISRNVQQASMGTQQVSANITDVQRGAGETASSQVLAAAQSLSGDSKRLKLEVGKFLNSVRAA